MGNWLACETVKINAGKSFYANLDIFIHIQGHDNLFHIYINKRELGLSFNELFKVCSII